jgi:hypothetical protein
MPKHNRQAKQLKNVSGGGQTPGTNWGTTPGEAADAAQKKGTTSERQDNEAPDIDVDTQTGVNTDG